VTDLSHEIHRLVLDGRRDEAAERLPVERPYPLPDELRATVGAT